MRPIALVAPTATAGGSERAFAALARELPLSGFAPTAILLERGPLEQWLEDACCPAVFVPADRTRYLHKTAATLLRIQRVLRSTKSEVVVSNQSKGHVLGGSAALMSRTPSIWWQQGIPEASRIELVAARVPAAVVVCSSDAALEAQRRITPRGLIRKIQLGTEIGEVAAHRGRGIALRRKLGWNGRPVVGIVGRLEPWKGQEVFLRAAALVSETHPAAQFAVVGGAVHGREGSYPGDLRTLTGQLGISEKVHFTGHRLDVWDWCDALDVVVHASFGEPFGLVVVEAMALAKPVIAAGDGGPLEIVEDGVSGLLTRPGDHEALAGSIRRLLDDPNLAAKLGGQAALRAHAFSAARMGRDFAAVIEAARASRRN
jgi:glycosyltransferase involved in cell wall biosynthesis